MFVGDKVLRFAIGRRLGYFILPFAARLAAFWSRWAWRSAAVRAGGAGVPVPDESRSRLFEMLAPSTIVPTRGWLLDGAVGLVLLSAGALLAGVVWAKAAVLKPSDSSAAARKVEDFISKEET